MKDRICLITGANAGIGLETARGLAQQGATILLTSRNQARGQAALDEIRKATGNDNLDLIILDLASLDSVRAAALDVNGKCDRVDVLINNAGLVLDERRETREGFEMTFGVNHLGHFLFTHLLIERLKKSDDARIINLSSDAHRSTSGLDFSDLNRTRRSYSTLGAYADSKLANIYFTTELARRFRDTPITAYAVHPGFVNTRFGRDGDITGPLSWLVRLITPIFARNPTKGAETPLYVATTDGVQRDNGGYFVDNKPATPTAVARDADAARQLWEQSLEMLGLNEEAA
ncbi:MAG: SDR family oxidoreductase [Myxococcota bacterium]